MEIFLNDCSFHEQYYERDKLEEGLHVFVGTLRLIQDINSDYIFYREPHLPYQALHHESLTVSLNQVRDRSLTRLLFEVLNRIAPANWRENPSHSTDDSFSCEGREVHDTALAELAERKLRSQDLVAALINFPNSRYRSKTDLNVTKNDLYSCRLVCVENQKQFADWLKEFLDLGSSNYDCNSSDPPRDSETVLRDVTRFRPTGTFQQGRRVYVEIDTRRFWYVDNLHTGGGAHLEVFDSRGAHLGESDLKGILNTSKRDREKDIDP